MTKIAAVGLVTAVAAGAACAGGVDGPPVIEVDRSACAHCGMLISEPRFAAAYQTGSDARLFDDIGCLLDSAPRGVDRSRTRFWFHDVNTAGWIDGQAAVFVHSTHVRTPMAGGYVAYGDRAAAERGAEAHEGRVIGGLDELLKQERKGGES